MIKSRRMRRAGHVARMVGKTKGKIFAEILYKLGNLLKDIG
jgi:hypothetical protein